MTIEELQGQLLDLQSRYETLNNEVKQKDELIEGFRSKEADHTKKVTEYQEQIMRLRDMNTELFLKVSQPIPQDIQEPLQEPQTPQEESISLNDILG